MNTREELNKEKEKNIKKDKLEKIKKIIFKIILILILIIGLLFIYMNKIETKKLIINEYNIIDNTLPNSFNGIKILHFSDLLYKTTTNLKTLEILKEKINNEKPDIIIFTGDITSNINLNDNDIKDLNNFFKDIKSKISTYLITGENDNKYTSDILLDTNIKLLDNQTDTIYTKENEFIEITNDTNYKENKNYKITIIHNLDNYENNNSDLILAGHNMRGEIYLFKPLLGNNKYNDNYYEINNTKAYISNGIGSIHKLRLLNKPSINIYRLYTN